MTYSPSTVAISLLIKKAGEDATEISIYVQIMNRVSSGLNVSEAKMYGNLSSRHDIVCKKGVPQGKYHVNVVRNDKAKKAKIRVNEKGLAMHAKTIETHTAFHNSPALFASPSFINMIMVKKILNFLAV